MSGFVPNPLDWRVVWTCHAVDGIVRAVNIDDYAYSRGKKEEAPDLVYIGASQNGGSAA
jgi:hypothetical protein